jgi:hypothetical protein
MRREASVWGLRAGRQKGERVFWLVAMGFEEQEYVKIGSSMCKCWKFGSTLYSR